MQTTLMLAARARDGHRGFYLPASGILSPYFQLKHCPDTEGRRSRGAGRDIQLIEISMVDKAIILGYVASGSGPMVAAAYYDGDTYVTSHADVMDLSASVDTAAEVMAAANAAIDAYASSQEWTIANKVWDRVVVAGLASAPQAAIANGPTNAPNTAPTNLNPITTLLGALTGEVNSTNSRQNQIADNVNTLGTKFNSLLTELRTLGLISS